ncbi:MAG: ESPR domain-containing protein, partial [Luteimonas sp.]
MNRIHRKVWNKSLGQLVVASELATSDSAGAHGDGGSGTVRRRAPVLAIATLLLGGLPALAFAQSAEVSALSWADGMGSTALGFQTYAAADQLEEAAEHTQYFAATGEGEAFVEGDEATASGSNAYAGADYATAVGSASGAYAAGASAFGSGATAFGQYSTASG